MTNITALNDGIIFSFFDETASGGFKNVTDWGFEIKDQSKDAGKARWGKIISTGPQVSTVLQPGMYVLIEELKWTSRVQIENTEPVWRTNEPYVLVYSVNPPIL